MTMNLKPFFTYYGGKYRTAPKYPKPRWKCIREPFAGSAGYSLRYYSRIIKLYEVNPKVVGTWDFLINATKREILKLPLVFDDVRDLHIPQEAKWLIGWWLNKGHTQPCNTPGQWMRLPTNDPSSRPNSFWGKTIRNRIASQVKYIRHWKIYNKSFIESPDRKCCWFVDPPYYKSGKHYPYREINYKQLASWCKNRLGQIIVCEQLGASWLPFVYFTNSKTTEGYKNPNISREVIWTNRNYEGEIVATV